MSIPKLELLSGDRPPPTDVVHFPDNLTPFPGNPTAEIHPLEINPPNPKFLQVNYGGPNFAEFSNSGQGLDENLLGCNSELGFLAQLACHDMHALFRVNSLAEQNGGDGATSAKGSSTLAQMRTVTDAEHRNITSQGRFLQAELSSSDDDCEPSEAYKEDLNQEKKRMKIEKLEIFLEDLISQVMQKQEQMHKQLMDMVEKKEQERIILEEAWKQQEIERAKGDEEERTQETLRSLALISFIQNLSYHDAEIPNSSEPSFRVKDCVGTQNHDCLPDESSNRRWPKTEVQALITVRLAIDRKFLAKGAKGSGWKEVAAALANLGYNRTPEKCREKWENINKYYKRTMESGKKHRRSLPYFDELDIIYKRGLLTQGNVNS